MGKYKRGTTITFHLETFNEQTKQQIDVSNVSCYVNRISDKVNVALLSASHVSTGYYRAHWQTNSNTELGKYEYKFVYKYQGTRIKSGVCEVVE